jgi:hypothetical protein
MIRALYEKLDIPPALLVREPSGKYAIEADFDEADIPLDLLQQRGWIEPGITAKQFLHRLLAPATVRYMRAFAAAWPERPIVQEALAQIPLAASAS